VEAVVTSWEILNEAFDILKGFLLFVSTFLIFIPFYIPRIYRLMDE
jgi:hypothetical protein